MSLNAGLRIAEVQGRPGTVRLVQKARRNSRVVPIDLSTGLDIGESELVPSDHLQNERKFKAGAETYHTIRISGRMYEKLAKLAKPFDTPADTIERYLPPVEAK